MSTRAPFKGNGEVKLESADDVEVEASRADFDSEAGIRWTKVPQPDFKAGGGLNNLASYILAS